MKTGKKIDKDSHNDYLKIKVTPNAGRNSITGYNDDILQVKIAAPPVKGKANQELIGFLSEVLDIKKSAITIIKGTTGRNKVIAVEGMTREAIVRRLLT